jgi:hypothetical protein
MNAAEATDHPSMERQNYFMRNICDFTAELSRRNPNLNAEKCAPHTPYDERACVRLAQLINGRDQDTLLVTNFALRAEYDRTSVNREKAKTQAQKIDRLKTLRFFSSFSDSELEP